jgi:hypothetical protein
MIIPDVDKYMHEIDKALQKHIKWPSPGFTEIYNRAYEAIAQAMRDVLEEENEKNHVD